MFSMPSIMRKSLNELAFGESPSLPKIDFGKMTPRPSIVNKFQNPHDARFENINKLPQINRKR
jgi:hypothetical protein